ncbi:MAG: apolipoprotein N-acyltransferase [Microthrixaceae bacterium]|nr:apolipoprotein N-acyltransferase [Microthrixaceae bacterium]
MHRGSRARLALGCVGAGLLLAASVPPWGWWPLAFVGIFALDRLLAGQPRAARFRRTWLVCAAWLYPSMLWMVDLTLPGYLIACAAYAAYFGAAVAVLPSSRWRWVGLPGAFVLAEWARWSWPFGGVPLSTLAMSQAAAPLAFTVRLAGSLVLVLCVVLIGVGLSALWERSPRSAGLAFGAVALLALAAWVAPRAHGVADLDIAIVQGGGPQRTRAADTDEREVFERHLAASEDVDGPVDLVLWPENVVNVEGSLEVNGENEELAALARELDTTLIVGVVEGAADNFLNAAVVYAPNGRIVDRYDKVKRVPFGEYVPLRSFLERFNSELPGRDALAGDTPAIVDTPAGRFGVVISWEVFFATRGRDAIGNGGGVLLNPTNGSSYWLTQVQSQQVASSRLRALENDRWVLQAAPTGFSAVVTPEGRVVERTGVSERRVLQHTITVREGETLATRVGDLPVLLVAVGSMAASVLLDRRARRRARDGDDGATAAGSVGA